MAALHLQHPAAETGLRPAAKPARTCGAERMDARKDARSDTEPHADRPEGGRPAGGKRRLYGRDAAVGHGARRPVHRGPRAEGCHRGRFDALGRPGDSCHPRPHDREADRGEVHPPPRQDPLRHRARRDADRHRVRFAQDPRAHREVGAVPVARRAGRGVAVRLPLRHRGLHGRGRVRPRARLRPRAGRGRLRPRGAVPVPGLRSADRAVAQRQAVAVLVVEMGRQGGGLAAAPGLRREAQHRPERQEAHQVAGQVDPVGRDGPPHRPVEEGRQRHVRHRREARSGAL